MVKNNVKPTSIRPRHGLLEKIDSICEKLDCSRNDYINTVLESAVSEDMEEENTPGPDRNPTPKKEPKPQSVIIYTDEEPETKTVEI